MTQLSVQDEQIDYDDFPVPQADEKERSGNVLEDVSGPEADEPSPTEQELKGCIAEIRSNEGSLMAMRQQSEQEAA